MSQGSGWRTGETAVTLAAALLRQAVHTAVRSVAPDRFLGSIFELEPSWLLARGVRGLVFDLDNTLGAYGFTALAPQVAAHLAGLRSSGLGTGFVSNHDGVGRAHLSEALGGAPVIWRAGKPRRSGFDRVLRALEVRPHQAAMVGDRLVHDVWGARRLGLMTLMVQPVIGAEEGLRLRLARSLERAPVLLSDALRRRADR